MVKVAKEDYFPRGSVPTPGSNSAITKKKRAKQQRKIFSEEPEYDVEAEDLFTEEQVKSKAKPTDQAGGVKGKKKKRDKNRLNTEENELLAGVNGHGIDKFDFDLVSYDTICEDFLLLGRISKIKNDKVVVNLPNRIVGEISLGDVSRPYTRIMEIVASGVHVDSPWYMLPQMFTEGQLISVKVKEIQAIPRGKKILLSSDPSSLHSNYSSSSIKKGMIFTAAVESVEDHGYIMDLGINGTRAFLDTENAAKFIKNVNEGKPLGLGQLVECQVLGAKLTNNLCTVKLTADPKTVHKYKYPDEMCLNYSLLLPGMLMEGIVMESFKGGLKVHVMELEGIVHKDHLKETWSSPLKHEISSKVLGRIIYLFPNGTNPYLSLQSKLSPHNIFVNESSVKLGGNEMVKVVRTDKSGIIIRFAGGEKGIVSLRRCSDDSSWTSQDVKKNFPKGSSHECKVLDFNSMDGMFIASFQKSIISQSVVRIDQVEPGQVVSCTIKRWTPHGALVNFGVIHGFIDNIHFGNVPLRSPATKFPPGTSVRAKVIEVCRDTGKIGLTAKKELVKEKSVFVSYQDFKKGYVAKGVVLSVRNNGIIVGTIGGIKGFVPWKYLGLDPGSDVQQLFFRGRLVTFQVVFVEPTTEKLIFSLEIIEENLTRAKAKAEFKKAKAEARAKKQAEGADAEKKGKKNKRQRQEEEQPENVDLEEGHEEVESPPKKKQKKNKDKKVKATEAKAEIAGGQEDQEEEEEEVEPVQTKGEQTLDEHGNLKLAVAPSSSFWDIGKSEDGLDKSEGSTLTLEEDSEISGEQKLVAGSGGKQLTKKEKRRLKERQMWEAELALADGGAGVRNEDDCERLILASPNSSMCWIQFMAFHVEKGEIVKAKEVGMRGLKTILFREEQERLNVWVALLNLENNYGTPESLNSVLQEAVRSNDDFKILSIMASIYCESNKLEEAEGIFKRLLKKFRDNPEPYIKYGKFLYKNNRHQDGRDLFQKALLYLDRTHHVVFISKYCRFELELGDRGRGCTLFEQLLGTYPKRIDVWLVYANALAKISDYEGAKNVLIRAVGSRFPPKKIKTVFARLFEIDKLCPNPDPDAIRQLAVEYTESINS